MNGKQARMLRQMRADKDDIAKWKTLPAELKGKLRRFHDTNEKAMYFSLPMAMRDTGSG